MHALLLLFAFLAVGFALPAPAGGSNALTLALRSADVDMAARDTTSDADTLAKQIATIAPGTSSCASATKYTNECRTASQAAQPILCSFDRYQITNVNEKAALVSLILYESGELKYNWGHFLNGKDAHEPGKGTRNMQSIIYNEEYARLFFPAAQVDAAKAVSDDAVLQLVSSDEYSFATAAWFLSSKCNDSTRSGLQSGSQEGFETYVTSCVGGTMDQKRIDYWTASKAALAG